MSWQRSRNSGGWFPLLVLGAAISAAFPSDLAAAEEPCNPIIDGTYCATNMPKNRAYARSTRGMTALEDYSRLVPSAAVGGTPGTLIGIGMQGSRTCFGLLRRSACD